MSTTLIAVALFVVMLAIFVVTLMACANPKLLVNAARAVSRPFAHRPAHHVHK